NEAYSYIPQSTVGDNTGMAVLYLDSELGSECGIVQEGHDSIVQEVNDDLDSLRNTFIFTGSSFKRELRFYNGISIEIPIEAEVGFTLGHSIKLKNYTVEDLEKAYRILKEEQEREREKDTKQSAEATELVG